MRNWIASGGGAGGVASPLTPADPGPGLPVPLARATPFGAVLPGLPDVA